MGQTPRRTIPMARMRLKVKVKREVLRQQEVRERKGLDLSRKTRGARARELDELADVASQGYIVVLFSRII